MGRPIKKKFFANLNAPYQDHATGGPTGEGGESVASVTIDTVGSYTAALPTITFGDPDLYSGVQATGIVHGKIVSSAVTANGSGYSVGDVLTVAGGTYSTQGRVAVTRIVSVAVAKHLNSGTGFTNGQTITFGQAGVAGCVTPLICTVYRPGGGSGSSDDYHLVVQAGVWSTTPANPVAMTSTSGGGSGATVDITWGVYSTGTVDEEGDYTAIATGARATTASPAGGTGATVTITYGVKNVEITNPGSHYISSADAAATFSTGAATGTAVLGNVRDNGLAAYAYIIDGTEGVLVDIMKQESSRRYLVKDDDGVQGQCRLVATDASYLDPGQMCLIATDTQGCTYFVTKLTARRAYLTQRTSAGTGYQFADGSSAGWNITGAVTGRVTIATV